MLSPLAVRGYVVFEVHNTVRCINASGTALTLQKLYIVLEVGSAFGFLGVKVDGVMHHYSPSRFELVTPDNLPKFDGNTKDDGDKLMGYSGVDLYFPRVLDLLALSLIDISEPTRPY